MAKKFKWNEEVEDDLRKANIPEETIAGLKNKDVEKISLDMLDGISGGGVCGAGEVQAPDDWSNPYAGNKTVLEAQHMAAAIYDRFGEDICADFCNSCFWPSDDWKTWIHQSGAAIAVSMMWRVCYVTTQPTAS